MRYRTFRLHGSTSFWLALGATMACCGVAEAQSVPARTHATRAAIGSPAPNFRADPMKPWWDTNPRPPSVLALLNPVRIATSGSADTKENTDAETRIESSRRVSGIAISGGVYAILESRLGVEVVRPGQVLDDGYRVEAIGADVVTLTKADGNRRVVERIRLTDAIPAR
jgi:hypothetical protein